MLYLISGIILILISIFGKGYLNGRKEKIRQEKLRELEELNKLGKKKKYWEV